MGDDQDRGPVDARWRAARKQLHDVSDRLGVERGGRLVGQDERRAVDQGPGDRDPLPLAAREVGRRIGEPVAQPELGEQPRRTAGSSRRRGRRLERGGHPDVLDRRQRAEQVVLLEDEADLPAELDLARVVQPVRSRPRTRRLPSWTCRRAPIRVRRVVLPEPDGPVRMTTSPRPISSVMSNRTCDRRLARPVEVSTSGAGWRLPGIRHSKPRWASRRWSARSRSVPGARDRASARSASAEELGGIDRAQPAAGQHARTERT